jgi:hypothetical protein
VDATGVPVASGVAVGDGTGEGKTSVLVGCCIIVGDGSGEVSCPFKGDIGCKGEGGIMGIGVGVDVKSASSVAMVETLSVINAFTSTP